MKPLELIREIEKTLNAEEVWRWEVVEESLIDEMFVQFKKLIGDGRKTYPVGHCQKCGTYIFAGTYVCFEGDCCQKCEPENWKG